MNAIPTVRLVSPLNFFYQNKLGIFFVAFEFVASMVEEILEVPPIGAIESSSFYLPIHCFY